mgnify:CR=1 FL=1
MQKNGPVPEWNKSSSSKNEKYGQRCPYFWYHLAKWLGGFSCSYLLIGRCDVARSCAILTESQALFKYAYKIETRVSFQVIASIAKLVWHLLLLISSEHNTFLENVVYAYLRLSAFHANDSHERSFIKQQLKQ